MHSQPKMSFRCQRIGKLFRGTQEKNVQVERFFSLQIYRFCNVPNDVCSRPAGINKGVSVDDPFAIHD